jgi:hypothetical protein
VSQTDTATPLEPPSTPLASLSALVIEAQCKINTSMSMLFTDVLSQELTSALTSPNAVAIIQSYLKNSPAAAATNPMADPTQLAPILDQVPESVLDVVKEAVFCSGALVRNVACQAELQVGQPLFYTGQAELMQIDILDGRVVAISALLKPQRLA